MARSRSSLAALAGAGSGEALSGSSSSGSSLRLRRSMRKRDQAMPQSQEPNDPSPRYCASLRYASRNVSCARSSASAASPRVRRRRKPRTLDWCARTSAPKSVSVLIETRHLASHGLSPGGIARPVEEPAQEPRQSHHEREDADHGQPVRYVVALDEVAAAAHRPEEHRERDADAHHEDAGLDRAPVAVVVAAVDDEVGRHGLALLGQGLHHAMAALLVLEGEVVGDDDDDDDGAPEDQRRIQAVKIEHHSLLCAPFPPGCGGGSIWMQAGQNKSAGSRKLPAPPLPR